MGVNTFLSLYLSVCYCVSLYLSVFLSLFLSDNTDNVFVSVSFSAFLSVPVVSVLIVFL